MYDYQGRSFLHIPNDVESDLKADEPPDKCFLPKKLIHTWYVWLLFYVAITFAIGS